MSRVCSQAPLHGGPVTIGGPAAMLPGAGRSVGQERVLRLAEGLSVAVTADADLYTVVKVVYL